MIDEEIVNLLKEKLPVSDVQIHRHANLRALGGGVEVADIILSFDGKMMTIPMDLPFSSDVVEYVVGKYQGTLARA